MLMPGAAGSTGSYVFANLDRTTVSTPPLSAFDSHPVPDSSGRDTYTSIGEDLLDPTQRSLQFFPSQPNKATAGGWGLGGMGGSGKEGGGGGGGGLFGGGGGGAGIDGSGGGGGSSYLHLPAAWVPTEASPTPPAPTVVEVRSTSVALRWPVVYLTAQRQPAAAYVVEMASGAVSDVRVQSVPFVGEGFLCCVCFPCDA